jgi:hypothetical protein
MPNTRRNADGGPIAIDMHVRGDPQPAACSGADLVAGHQ